MYMSLAHNSLTNIVCLMNILLQIASHSRSLLQHSELME